MQCSSTCRHGLVTIVASLTHRRINLSINVKLLSVTVMVQLN